MPSHVDGVHGEYGINSEIISKRFVNKKAFQYDAY